MNLENKFYMSKSLRLYRHAIVLDGIKLTYPIITQLILNPDNLKIVQQNIQKICERLNFELGFSFCPKLKFKILVTT